MSDFLIVILLFIALLQIHDKFNAKSSTNR
jgi:hypothetical protein